ncbi:MAG: MFS transporter [Kofleriaceae bacterium]
MSQLPSVAPPVAPRRLWSPAMVRVTVTLLLGAGVTNLFVIAPRFLGARGYDKRDIGVVMGAFGLASLLMSTQVARWIARVGFKGVIASGCALAAVGAAVFATSSTMAGFAAARALQGLGMSALMIGAAAYVAESTPPAKLGQALGAAGVLTLVAMAVGPALAQLIHDHAGWAAVWWAGVASGLAALAVAAGLPPVTPHDHPLPLAAGGAGPTLVATSLAGVGFGTIWTFLADYGPRVGAPTVTGFFLAYVAAAVSTRLGLGSLSDRFGRRAVVAPALLGHAVALAGMAGLGAGWHLYVIGALYGLCHGLYYPAMQALVVEQSGGRPSGAIGVSTFAFGLGQVVAAFGLGPVARAWGYPAIYLVGAGAGVVAAGLIIAGRGRA